MTDDESETEFLLITNLTRPFTVKSFQEMLKRTGTIEDFWIDRYRRKSSFYFFIFTVKICPGSNLPVVSSSVPRTKPVKPRWP